MQTRRRRMLSEADRAEWAAFARHVAALPGRSIPEAPLPVAPTLPGVVPAATAADPTTLPIKAAKRPSAPLAIGSDPTGLDRGSWNRLRAGKLAPTRTLDLHGRTAHAAHVALHDFLLRAQADRLRCVEVITGRGSGEGGGVLRRELPLWLNAPALRPLLLAASHPHPANPGSVRLLLRRTR